MLVAQSIEHTYTHLYQPQANGKVERFTPTLMAEWAYTDTHDGDATRARRYPEWLHE